MCSRTPHVDHVKVNALLILSSINYIGVLKFYAVLYRLNSNNICFSQQEQTKLFTHLHVQQIMNSTNFVINKIHGTKMPYIHNAKKHSVEILQHLNAKPSGAEAWLTWQHGTMLATEVDVVSNLRAFMTLRCYISALFVLVLRKGVPK